MWALRCHSRTQRVARDDPSLAEAVKEHLLEEHPGLRPTGEQVWDTVRRRTYYFDAYDPQYAGVRIHYFL